MSPLLERFAEALDPAQPQILADVGEYVAWLADRREAEFVPSAADDVELRTYLHHLRLGGAGRAAVSAKVASLKRFYRWALAQGLIRSDPFDDFNFERPFLSRDQIRRREDVFSADPAEREIARLRALNHLAEHLNRSLDVRTALDATLATLVEVMGLNTAWAFLLTESGLASFMAATPPHDFALAAACDLPPGLEQEGRAFLCRPPDCHCQYLLREGRLTRAVNIVECTRLQDSAAAEGDNLGLLFHASVPLLAQGRPLGILNFATEEWQFLTAADLQLLSAAGLQVATALERAHLYTLTQAHRRRLESELEMAREVQASLLPAQLPNIRGFRLAAIWRAAGEVAGDFYDVFRLPDGRWGLVVADVSDKGAPAALYMAMARSLIRTRAEGTASPAALLMDVNRALCTQSSAEMFVTVFYAVLDSAAGTLSYANAGHYPPILRRADGRAEPLPRGGMVLGALAETRLDDRTLTLGPGEALVAFTDGVTDALNPQGKDYGTARLRQTIGGGPSAAADLLSHLMADLTAFIADADQPDDVTLLVLSRE